MLPIKQKFAFCPHNGQKKRIDHFKTLLQARAIENQMIMISSNVCGKIQNTNFGGHSSIIDHMGKIRAKIINSESSSTFQISIDDLRQWRNDFPVLIDANLQFEQAIKIYKVEE